MSISFDKVYGLIYGQMTGDALGGRYEFLLKDNAVSKIKEDISLMPPSLDILGGGPFKLIPGQITDDSELALIILDSISRKVTYDKDDVAKGYIDWYNSNPFDIGMATSAAFNEAKNYNNMVYNSKFRDMGSSVPSMSNGSLMRISPLALLITKGIPKEKIMDYAIEDTMMTHSSVEVQDATRVYVSILCDLLVGIQKNKAVNNGLSIAATNLVRSILGMAIDGKNPTNGTLLSDGTIVLPHSKYSGYFGIALHNAIYHLLHGTSYFSSLVATIRMGGDTDTNACICGAILGTLYGYNSIPCQWTKVVRAVPKYLSNRSKPPPIYQGDIDAMVKLLYNIK